MAMEIDSRVLAEVGTKVALIALVSVFAIWGVASTFFDRKTRRFNDEINKNNGKGRG